jgi:hypothetical protein
MLMNRLRLLLTLGKSALKIRTRWFHAVWLMLLAVQGWLAVCNGWLQKGWLHKGGWLYKGWLHKGWLHKGWLQGWLHNGWLHKG